jgi:tetratricopeptide (TPR) repeat protein
MNYFKQTIMILLVISANRGLAQSTYDKLGMQALVKGDFKGAVTQLEKADTKDPNNANVLKMLGYSYYQCGDYENSISTYSKFITLKPSDYSAYYYRGKARLNVANDPKESLSQLRENFYLSAIKDFTKAIEINGEEDLSCCKTGGWRIKIMRSINPTKLKSLPKRPLVSVYLIILLPTLIRSF